MQLFCTVHDKNSLHKNVMFLEEMSSKTLIAQIKKKM